MTRYKAPTIAERGGLKAYLTELGIDYELFRTLHSTIGKKYKVIADALTDSADKSKLTTRLRPQRIKFWCEIDDQEQLNHAKSTTS